MKIFPVLLGLLLFGFINSSTSMIRDLEVLKEYTFVSSYTHYYFRVEVSNLVNMYIQLSAKDVDTNSKADFKLDICGFYDYPSDRDVMYGHEDCVSANTPSLEKKNGYVYYKYTWKELKDINYLAFSLTTMKNDVNPYTLFIYSEYMENTEKTELADSVVEAGK